VNGQRSHHEDVARVCIDRCELAWRQLAQVTIWNDAPKVASGNQLQRACALVGSVKVKSEGDEAIQEFGCRLAAGFTATDSRTLQVSIRRGDHSVLVGWDSPIGGCMFVEERRVEQNCRRVQEALCK
jgi:hypothetical protein